MVTDATPPGWYPDPWNHSAQRFWDGHRWTEHAAAAGGPSDRPRLPDGAAIYGPWIWIVALLPLLGAVLIWFVQIDLAPYLDYLKQLTNYQAGGGPMPRPLNPLSMFGPGYYVELVLSLLAYAAMIVFAALDSRRLERIGVERPFPWQWAFLVSLIYVIGRSVVVRRVAGPRGAAPMWAGIGAYAAAMVSSIVWSSIFAAQLTSQITELVNSYPTS